MEVIHSKNISTKPFLSRSNVIDINGLTSSVSFMNFSFLARCAACFSVAVLSAPLFALAQEQVATLTAAPASVTVGAPVTVTFSIPPTSASFVDRLQLIESETNRFIEAQYLSGAVSGSKVFIPRAPGTYVIEYFSGTANTVLGRSSAFTVRALTAADAGASVSVSPATVVAGGNVTATFTISPTVANYSDRLQVTEVASNRLIDVQYLYGTSSGTKTFRMSAPGTYIIAYYSLTTNGIVATSNPFVVQPITPENSGASITLSASSVPAGSPITATFSMPASIVSVADSLRLVESPGGRFISSQFLSGSAQGTRSFTVTAPGSYAIELFSIVANGVIARSPVFTVTLPGPEMFTLTATPPIAELLQPITVSYSAPASLAGFADSIQVVDRSTGAVLQTVFVSGPSGSRQFSFAATGTYEFRYRLSIFGSATVRTSAPVEVRLIDFSRIVNYPLRATGPIIALGDSITAGRDATEGNDYVSVLSRSIGTPILNAGVRGNTTADVLARLDRDVLSKNPRLVILLIGGNDFLQGVPSATSFSNIRTIIDRIHASGSAVLLVGIRSFLFADYDAQFRSIAFGAGSAYVPDALRGIIGNPLLTTDLVHPTDRGHFILANRILPYVQLLTR
jgi:lysophospholipase L1-like esterase